MEREKAAFPFIFAFPAAVLRHFIGFENTARQTEKFRCISELNLFYISRIFNRIPVIKKLQCAVSRF